MKRKVFIDMINDIADYYVTNKSTIRETAKYFGLSKSYVHMLFNKYLKDYNFDLYTKVREVTDINSKERYYRGGEATKLHFIKLKNKNL